ncbi:MAG: hypothetical protein JW894_13640 [Bacteroidales bacterium]|nr:hypothetical protein [Bacteroidales bacterium]
MSDIHANKLKELIVKAIEDHELSRAEHEEILNLALEDGHIDNHEQALLVQLQEMIANKTIRLVK